MAVTNRIIISQLTSKYAQQLRHYSQWLVPYLEQAHEQEYPAGRAANLLPLVQASLKRLVVGYHSQTGYSTWAERGADLARTELRTALECGYINQDKVDEQMRKVDAAADPLVLLHLIAKIWAASREKARQPRQAA